LINKAKTWEKEFFNVMTGATSEIADIIDKQFVSCNKNARFYYL